MIDQPVLYCSSSNSNQVNDNDALSISNTPDSETINKRRTVRNFYSQWQELQLAKFQFKKFLSKNHEQRYLRDWYRYLHLGHNTPSSKAFTLVSTFYPILTEKKPKAEDK